MKAIDKKSLAVRVVTGVLLLLACFYMYDFYKCLSGFIANGFREPLVMLPMILAFFLPVLCFLFFFYDFYVKPLSSVVKTGYSVFVALYAVADFALIFRNISLYVSNHALGVYEALPSIIVDFPYDMIAVLAALLVLQIFHLFFERSGTRAGDFWDNLKERGTVQVTLLEYILLSVLAIVAFVFVGAGITAAFTAFGNAFYDFRYAFLLLWVGLVPLANLLLLVLKPERTALSRGAKQILLGTGIGVNVLFGVLFLVFELTYPDFLVHIGKPLFLIAFSVSLPIEPAIILAVMALGTAIFAVRFVRLWRKKVI